MEDQLSLFNNTKKNLQPPVTVKNNSSYKPLTLETALDPKTAQGDAVLIIRRLLSTEMKANRHQLKLHNLLKCEIALKQGNLPPELASRQALIEGLMR